MRIIQVSSYYPPHLGGMENAVREISERLSRKGHQIEVFTSDIGCKKEKAESANKFQVNYFKSIEIAHTPIFPSLFFKLLTIPKKTIIHLHLAQSFIPEIVWLISKIKGTPYVIYVHLDVGPSGKLGFLLPLYKKVFLKRVFKSADKIIVPTKDYISLIEQKYSIPRANICLIPYGVVLENFQQSKTKMNPPEKLLFVGRLSIQKNIPLLIQSFIRVIKNNHPNVILHIVGDGEEKNKIIEIIRKERLENNIVLHGALRGKNLSDIYSNSNIFILTSREESFGIVLIEAMASGLPIIASDIPGLRNVVINGKTGLLVEPSVKNFANAIEEMITNNASRTNLIKNGLKEVKKYDWDKIVEQYEKIYMEVLSETD